MKKKFVAGAVTLLSVVTLAACAKGGSDKDIVTMKGDTITVSDFYDEIKRNFISFLITQHLIYGIFYIYRI